MGLRCFEIKRGLSTTPSQRNPILTKIQQERSVDDFYISEDWLIGFWEAEGWLSGNKGEQASWGITQHIADWALMEARAKFLGSGTVRPNIREGGEAHWPKVNVIYDRVVLRTVIIPLLNGNLRTAKKLERFNKWCSDCFDITPSTHTPLTAAAGPAAGWLSGFTDGDGSFFPLISKNTGYRIGYQVIDLRSMI